MELTSQWVSFLHRIELTIILWSSVSRTKNGVLGSGKILSERIGASLPMAQPRPQVKHYGSETLPYVY
jgi:hypothetical protein